MVIRKRDKRRRRSREDMRKASTRGRRERGKDRGKKGKTDVEGKAIERKGDEDNAGAKGKTRIGRTE